MQDNHHYVLMMISKSGTIVSHRAEEFDQAVNLGELMVEQHQALSYDIFQTQPARRFIPASEYHEQNT